MTKNIFWMILRCVENAEVNKLTPFAHGSLFHSRLQKHLTTHTHRFSGANVPRVCVRKRQR